MLNENLSRIKVDNRVDLSSMFNPFFNTMNCQLVQSNQIRQVQSAYSEVSTPQKRPGILKKTKKINKNKLIKSKIRTLSQQSSDAENSSSQNVYCWEEEDDFYNLQNKKQQLRKCENLGKIISCLELFIDKAKQAIKMLAEQ